MQDYIHEVLQSKASHLEKVERIAEVLRSNPSLWPLAMAGNIVAVEALTEVDSGAFGAGGKVMKGEIVTDDEREGLVKTLAANLGVRRDPDLVASARGYWGDASAPVQMKRVESQLRSMSNSQLLELGERHKVGWW